MQICPHRQITVLDTHDGRSQSLLLLYLSFGIHLKLMPHQNPVLASDRCFAEPATSLCAGSLSPGQHIPHMQEPAFDGANSAQEWRCDVGMGIDDITGLAEVPLRLESLTPYLWQALVKEQQASQSLGVSLRLVFWLAVV